MNRATVKHFVGWLPLAAWAKNDLKTSLVTIFIFCLFHNLYKIIQSYEKNEAGERKKVECENS